MGSTFTTSKAAKIKTTFGQGKFIPFYLQFVPGRVEVVVTSDVHPFARSSDGNVYSNNINSIIAFPYYNKIKKRTDIFNNGNYDKYRYFPLLRGMYEVPAKGDPILLCTIGGQNFYLGPLNTENNPNWNNDLLKSQMYPHQNSKNNDTFMGGEFNDLKVSADDKSFQKQPRLRLQKLPDQTVSDNHFKNLDNPKGIADNRSLHGDIMLEGRHGNNIRIGSRFTNPYLFISNGIGVSNTRESLGIGSIISLTQQGTLSQHFKSYVTEDDESVYKVPGFILASEKDNETTRNMATSLHLSEENNEDYIPSQQIYNYGQQQILIDSHRVTLNSKTDDVYVSSADKIHIGAKNDITITAKNDLIFNTKYTYLGGMSKIHHYNELLDDDDEKKDSDMTKAEPIVLGEQLYTILNELVDCLSSACYVTMAGNAVPLVDNLYKPIGVADNKDLKNEKDEDTPRVSLINIKNKLDSIKSIYHFVENNDEEKDPPPAGEGPGETTTSPPEVG